MAFVRRFSLVKELISPNSLFIKKLKEDCLSGKVFPAVRNECMDFYYKGGRLFNYDKNGFKTHNKYTAVIEPIINPKNNKQEIYITEDKLKNVKVISDFESGYKRIKENCENYSGVEAAGVAELYHKYSFANKKYNGDYVVLDIEAAFKPVLDEEKKSDRIDIILYDRKNCTIRFVEAKHYSNPELWSEGTPPIVNQIDRYDKQLKKSKQEILKAYSDYIEIMNNIFDLDLPLPKSIDEKVHLLIFGFDRNQKSGRFTSLILKNQNIKDISYYAKGEIGSIKISSLWNECKVINASKNP